MHFKHVALALALAHTGYAFDVTILADTNRDGRVDDYDTTNKHKWTNDVGALFLANIGDTNGRCSSNITEDTPDGDIDKCNDASDNILRNSNLLAPLATLPLPSLSNDAVATVNVTNANVANLVRIFFRRGRNPWQFVTEDYKFDVADIRNGLQLGIDSRDVRRPQPGWDGRATIMFTVKDGNHTSSDNVAMRVAPLLIHHNLQEAQQLFMIGANKTDIDATKFQRDVLRVASKAGMPEQTVILPVNPDRWTQDFYEPGYMSIPGPNNNPIVIRINIRAPQVTRFAGRYVFTHMRSSTVGGVQFLAAGGSQDSCGNVEAIPPYEFNGTKYPAGRAIQGRQVPRPLYMSLFLDAQETQKPLELDTSWLLVGHVDEFIQFLPANTPRGWVVAVDDPMAGLEIFEDIQKLGMGTLRWLSRLFHLSKRDEINGKGTINQLLSLPNMTTFNQECAKKIEANLDILKRETGITEKEIIRVPGIYYAFVKVTPGPGDENQGPGNSPVLNIISAAEGIFSAAYSAASGAYSAAAASAGIPGAAFPGLSGTYPIPAENAATAANDIINAAGGIFNAAGGILSAVGDAVGNSFSGIFGGKPGSGSGAAAGASSSAGGSGSSSSSASASSSGGGSASASAGSSSGGNKGGSSIFNPFGIFNPFASIIHRRMERRQEQERQQSQPGDQPVLQAVRLTSATPALINGVVLSNKNYLAADPFGPLVNGRDILQDKAREIYGKVDMNVNFVDDWFTLHVYQGEVHCATNVAREADIPWWN